MTTHTMRGLSASALAALVLIWNEAPIADSPSFHVAAADQPSARQMKAAEPDVPNVNSGPVTEQRSDAVVRGGRTGVGPAARPARPAQAPDANDKDTTTGRTGAGPAADHGRPAAGENNVAH